MSRTQNYTKKKFVDFWSGFTPVFIRRKFILGRRRVVYDFKRAFRFVIGYLGK